MTTPSLPPDHADRMARVGLTLDGLSVGDAFGGQFFIPANAAQVEAGRDPLPDPPGTWHYTDDTVMALSIAEVLDRHGHVHQDDLAAGFARRFRAEPYRGYGAGAFQLLAAIGGGADWRVAARNLFGGMGSFGNGSAMRVAPVGAYFADDPAAVVEHARRASEVTHAHPEGVAGGIAVAVAAAYVWRHRGRGGDPAVRRGLFNAVLAATPEGDTRFGIAHDSAVDLGLSVEPAARLLGNGSRVTCMDTVSFCVWVMARHLDDYPAAVHAVVRAGGDVDTTGAIVGGVVALAVGEAGIPRDWLASRENLP